MFHTELKSVSSQTEAEYSPQMNTDQMRDLTQGRKVQTNPDISLRHCLRSFFVFLSVFICVHPRRNSFRRARLVAGGGHQVICVGLLINNGRLFEVVFWWRRRRLPLQPRRAPGVGPGGLAV